MTNVANPEFFREMGRVETFRTRVYETKSNHISKHENTIPAEIREAVRYGEIIEIYSEDKRGESCLILLITQNRAIHVVCAPKTEYLAIITAYLPLPGQWSSDFKVRK